MGLTIIGTKIGPFDYMYVVDEDIAKEKMNSSKVVEYIPVTDKKVLDYFLGLYHQIIKEKTAPGRENAMFQMLTVSDKWYLAEIKLSNDRDVYFRQN